MSFFNELFANSVKNFEKMRKIFLKQCILRFWGFRILKNSHQLTVCLSYVFFIKNISDQILIYLISCCDEYISPTLKFVSRILFISSCSGGKRTKVPILLKRDVRSISNYKYFCVEIDIFKSLKFSKIEETQFFELFTIFIQEMGYSFMFKHEKTIIFYHVQGRRLSKTLSPGQYVP